MNVPRIAVVLPSSILSVLLVSCGDKPKPPTTPTTPTTSTPAAMATTSDPIAQVAPPQPAMAPAAPAGVKRIDVVDTGLGAPLTAFSVEVPAAWMPYGGIQWNRNVPCITNQQQVEWGAGSSDRSHAIELLPAFGWQLSGWDQQTNPCPVFAIGSVRDFLNAVAGQRYRNATVVDYRERPDLVAELATPKAADPSQNARSFSEGGEMELVFQVDGREIRQTMAAVATFTEMSLPNMRPSRMGYVGSVFVVRAPKEAFDAALGERVRKSVKSDPQWAARYMAYGKDYVDRQGSQQSDDIARWHNQRMAEINARGAADRAAIRSNTAREVADINSKGWQARQDSQDRMHRNNVDTIREVQRYQDPSGNRQVELSSHYNYGWKTSNGTYVANDDPNFNPGTGGQQMQRAP